jgi:hypothetical protein
VGKVKLAQAESFFGREVCGLIVACGAAIWPQMNRIAPIGTVRARQPDALTGQPIGAFG